MKITNEMVQQLADLAQLRLEDAQLEPMRAEVDAAVEDAVAFAKQLV